MALAMVVVVGCGKVLGIDEYRVGGPSGNPGGRSEAGVRDAASREASTDASPAYFSKDFKVGFASAECGACSDQHCKAAEINCGLIPDCYDWAICRAACTDAKCIAQCPRRAPRVKGLSGPFPQTDLPVAADYGACLNRSCSEQCLARAAGVDAEMSPDCYDCTVEQCGDPLGHPRDGSTLGTCFSGSCNAVCSGSDWSCVGHVQWPDSIPGSATYTVSAFDFVNPGQTIPRYTARACNVRTGDDCATPVSGPNTADGNGSTTFEFLPLGPTSVALFDYWEFLPPALPDAGGPQYLKSLNWMTPRPVRTGTDQRGELPMSVLASSSWLGSDLEHCGYVGVLAQDCRYKQAAEVELKVEQLDVGSPCNSPLQVIYADLLQPLVGATQTGNTGIAVAINVKPGSVRVQTLHAGQLVAEWNAVVRAGWGTHFDLPPTPLGSN